MLSALDEQLYIFNSEVDLNVGETRCGVNHGINYKDNPFAIDYLCQDLSKKDNIDITLRIPICSECAAALYSDHQILFICISCSSSQWLFRETAKQKYPEDMHVLFFKRCPHCS